MSLEFKPELLRLSNPAERARWQALQADKLVDEVIDALPEAVEDLFKIDFPFVAPGSPEFQKTFVRYEERFYNGSEPEAVGVWLYYPWRRVLVRLPEPADYHKLRTARNKFLITPEEQAQFSQATVAIGGLSVGFSALNSLVLSGGPARLRLADPDSLAITNLNRLPASVADLGRKKAVIAARRVYELNPFAEIGLFADGLTAENLPQFLDGVDLFVEEMDNLKLKIDSRFAARAAKIPVIMATDNGDNAIIDVERFDLEPDHPLFHGKIDEAILKAIPAQPSPVQRVQIASQIVGNDITPRTQQSLMMVGNRLPSWPQLGNAATLSGVAVSYVARRILTGQSMPSGRYEVNLDSLIDPDFHSPAAEQARAQQTQDFIEGFQLLFGQEGQ